MHERTCLCTLTHARRRAAHTAATLGGMSKRGRGQRPPGLLCKGGASRAGAKVSAAHPLIKPRDKKAPWAGEPRSAHAGCHSCSAHPTNLLRCKPNKRCPCIIFRRDGAGSADAATRHAPQAAGSAPPEARSLVPGVMLSQQRRQRRGGPHRARCRHARQLRRQGLRRPKAGSSGLSWAACLQPGRCRGAQAAKKAQRHKAGNNEQMQHQLS